MLITLVSCAFACFLSCVDSLTYVFRGALKDMANEDFNYRK